MDYHGDLAIHGATGDGVDLSCVECFAHETVEWISPFDALPEIRQLWQICRALWAEWKQKPKRVQRRFLAYLLPLAASAAC